MPKERINNPPVVYAGQDEGPIAWKPAEGAGSPGAWVEAAPQEIRRDAVVTVGWHKDSWVQISLEGEPSYFRMAAEHPDISEERTSVYTPPLTRDDINKLIRVLRRAREQVFGRDE